MSHELTLKYECSLEHCETGELLTDPARLASCHGLRDRYDLASMSSEYDFSNGLEVSSIVPELFFEPGSGLELHLRVQMNRSPSASDVEQLASFLRSLFSRHSLELDLPEELDGFVPHRGKLKTPVARPQADEIEAIAAEWKGVTYETLAALSDEKLDALVARLRPLEPRFRRDARDGGAAREVGALFDAACAHRQHRRLPPLR